jgi:hypothetical protein
MEKLKDIKPPVYFSADYRFILVIAALLFACLLIYIAYLFIRKKKSQTGQNASYQAIPAHERAYAALRQLKAKDLARLGLVKEYYFILSGIVRHYLEDRFFIRAPEMTTEEFLNFMRGSDILTGAQKNIVKDFLSHCDMVKFARYSPPGEEIEYSMSAAYKLIDETKEQLIEQDNSKRQAV